MCAEFVMLTLMIKKKIQTAAENLGEIRGGGKRRERKGLVLPDTKIYYKSTIITMVKI